MAGTEAAMAERRPTDRELPRNQVWNELIRSGRVPATADLDPIDVDALRQLHRLASASAPASSRERVRRRLREQSPSFGFADAAQGVTMDAANVFPPAMRPPRPIR